MTHVELKNVYKKYNQIEAVKGVSFQCETGEFFCILGSSGAGKTSLLKMIAGIEDVTSGEIYLEGRLSNHVRPFERDIAMMFENYALYPNLTVFDNIASPLRSPKNRSKYSEKEVKATVTRVAEMLSIGYLLDRYPRQLSGGQKQRVALGRVLVRRSSVYLLDEPISHLDAKLRHEMRTELKKIHKEVGTSFIYSTPDQIEALSMADRMLILKEGVVQQIGAPEEVYYHPVNEFVASFVGDPSMNIFDCILEERGDKLFIKRGEKFILELPKEKALGLKKNKVVQKKVKVGIRPADITIVKERISERVFEGKVYICEPLGRYTIITVNIEDLLLKVKVEGNIRVKEGERIQIGLDLGKIYLFDFESGKAII